MTTLKRTLAIALLTPLLLAAVATWRKAHLPPGPASRVPAPTASAGGERTGTAGLPSPPSPSVAAGEPAGTEAGPAQTAGAVAAEWIETFFTPPSGCRLDDPALVRRTTAAYLQRLRRAPTTSLMRGVWSAVSDVRSYPSAASPLAVTVTFRLDPGSSEPISSMARTWMAVTVTLVPANGRLLVDDVR